jgi:hypothetical protein
METSIMNICSKFGYNKVVLHTKRLLLHICEIFMRRQWELLCICWSRSENQVVWFLLLNYQMHPIRLCIQRWTIWYVTHFGPVLHWKRYEFATNDKNDRLHIGLLPIRNKSSLGGWGILYNKLAHF